jgi:hypothetical protein
MADDLIHCPACGFQLRLPTDLYGSEVECPKCHGRFTAPVSVAKPAPVRPPPGREYDAVAQPGPGEYDNAPPSNQGAAAAVKTPAIILIVLSGMTALASLYGVVTAQQTVARTRDALEQMEKAPNSTPEGRDFMRQMSANVTPELVVGANLAMAGVGLVTILGGIQMLRLRTYWIAIIGAIFAMNPVNCPCCIAEFPIAIWALVVLLRANVRAAFQ